MPAESDSPKKEARTAKGPARGKRKPMGVVGLGASAGGVAVLREFFEQMPTDSGLAFVVVMHLSPEHESNLDKMHRLYVRRSVPRPGWAAATLPSPVLRHAARKSVLLPKPLLPALHPRRIDTTADRTSTSSGAAEARRALLFGELHLKLLEQYGPPSVVINGAHDIVHLSEHAGRYLQFGGGEPSANLMKLVLLQMRVELRTAIFRAHQRFRR